MKANIAWCPVHGLHGCRDSCFECGGPVEQIKMAEVPFNGRGYVISLFALALSGLLVFATGLVAGLILFVWAFA